MKARWFTLIEILIVIFIFWVGILSVLKVLTMSLGYFDLITMRTKANFLAKEGIEMMFNLRDSNIEQGYPRNFLGEEDGKLILLGQEGKNTFRIGYTGTSEYRDLQGEEKKGDFNIDFQTFYLSLLSGEQEKFSYYSHEPQSLLPYQGFARILELSPLKEGEQTLDPNKVLKISSKVRYKRDNYTGEVILESIIGMKDSLPITNE